MKIHLVFICYNRLYYTIKALESILSDPTEEFYLTIWDNASDDGTQEFLKKEISDPRIIEVVFSKKNVGQIAAVNEIWSNSKADLLGKLDNDCIVTPGWTRILSAAHRDIPDLGIVACWHYLKSDFNYERARHKIQRFGSHYIFRHPWTCGTGFLIKRLTYKKFGPIKDSATTSYMLSLAKAGYINGFYYPLVFQEHMDDPLSIHTVLKDEDTYQAAKANTFNINRHGQRHLKDRLRWRKVVLDNLMDDHWETKYYEGWRNVIRTVKMRIRMRNFFHLN